MSDLVYARVSELLARFHLNHTNRHLDEILAEAARTEPAYLDFLDQILQQESSDKQQLRIQMLTQMAKFPHVKSLDQFDFEAQPSVDKKLVQELKTARFIAKKENVLLFGPPGVGKTHIALGIGLSAIHHGMSTLFVTAHTLLSTLLTAQKQGESEKQLKYYGKPQLLIIDELGYLPMDKTSAHLFFQVITQRYEQGSLLITTNQLVGQWGQLFGDEMVAAAILDRLLHHSHTLLIQGESYRLRHKRKNSTLFNKTTNTQPTTQNQGVNFTGEKGSISPGD